MKSTGKFAILTRGSLFAGTVLCAAALMLLGGCQTVRPPAPGPCSPADTKPPGQSVPDRFVPVVRGENVSDAGKYEPCEVIANSTFTMRAEYEWVPNLNRGKVKLWLQATAKTLDGEELSGDEIFVNANAPIEFDLTWGNGDPVGRPIIRTIDLTLREGVEAGTELSVRLRDPGELDGWPGPTAVFGPMAVLKVVKARPTEVQGAALMNKPAGSAGPAPKGERPQLLGQSVPDKFNVPTPPSPTQPLTVKQGGKLTFEFHVNGNPGDRPVGDVTLLLTTNSVSWPFDANNKYVQRITTIGASGTFEVLIDPQAPVGNYTVKACLSPFIFPLIDGTLPAVREIQFTVTQKENSSSPSATLGK